MIWFAPKDSPTYALANGFLFPRINLYAGSQTRGRPHEEEVSSTQQRVLPYIATLNVEGSSKVLTPALESVISGKIAGTEDRISRMIFKLAVEIAVQNHLTAGRYEFQEG